MSIEDIALYCRRTCNLCDMHFKSERKIETRSETNKSFFSNIEENPLDRTYFFSAYRVTDDSVRIALIRNLANK